MATIMFTTLEIKFPIAYSFLAPPNISVDYNPLLREPIIARPSKTIKVVKAHFQSMHPQH